MEKFGITIILVVFCVVIPISVVLVLFCIDSLLFFSYHLFEFLLSNDLLVLCELNSEQ